MATSSNTYRAYSMEYGTFVGIGWGALFLSYVGGVVGNSWMLMLLCVVLCGVCFMLPFALAARLGRRLRVAGERIGYLQGLLFAFSMFMYACLMDGIISFAYFQFFDDGMLLEQMAGMLSLPEAQSAYRQMGMEAQYEQVKEMLMDWGTWSPMEKALAVFNNNFFFGFIMSFVVAAVPTYKSRD